ncbi:MAG TPA: hypothetical protein VES20_00800, partial [Bryobacteraceae bacterium]|nr:hypothetical protein [Bryobacteraceae bacterium]
MVRTIAAIGLAAALGCGAQTVETTIERAPAPGAGPEMIEFVHNEFALGSKVVKGAPYAAEAVTETVQTLGDGNRIVHKSTVQMARDGQGRTRRDLSPLRIGPLA